MTFLENDFTAIGQYLPLHRSLLPLAGPRFTGPPLSRSVLSSSSNFVALVPGFSQVLDTGVPLSLLPYDKEVGLMGKQRGSESVAGVGVLGGAHYLTGLQSSQGVSGGNGM